MTEMQEMERKLETFRSEANRQFTEVRGDLKELTAAMRDLIRLDGELKGITTAITRMGRQVDDHEERMRELETTDAVTNTKLGAGERVFWAVFSLACSGAGAFIASRIGN